MISPADIEAAHQRIAPYIRETPVIALEPGGATTLAALTSGVYQPAPDERVGVLICGGNTDPGTVG